MRTNILFTTAVIALLTLVGCGDTAPVASTTGESVATGLAAPPLPETTGPIQPVLPAATPEEIAAAAPQTPAAPTETTPAVEDDTTRVAAETGVGKKGHYENGGYIGTVVSARFRAEETIVFAQVQRALDLYKADHNGKGPATNEIFMKEVIELNSLNLPELPAGERYEYNPKDGQLYVLQPK